MTTEARHSVGSVLIVSTLVSALALLLGGSLAAHANAAAGWQVLQLSTPLDGPGFVGVDAQDRLVVADRCNARIMRFERDGRPIDQIPGNCTSVSMGTGPTIPIVRGVSLGPHSEIDVTTFQFGRNSYRAYASDMSTTATWDYTVRGDIGTAVGRAPDGTLLLSASSILARYTLEGQRLSSRVLETRWDAMSTNWHADRGAVKGIAVAPDGTLYIVNPGESLVERLTPDLERLPSWGVTWDPRAPGGLLTSIAVDSRGITYVANGSASILKLSPSNTPLALLSPHDVPPGQLRGTALETILALAVDAQDRVYAFDAVGRQILVFEPDGRQLAAWSLQDDAADPEAGPPLRTQAALAIAPDGTFFVADSSATRIRHFSPAGELLDAWGSDWHDAHPTSLAVDQDGVVWVGDQRGRIRLFTPSGDFIRVWADFGTSSARMTGLSLNGDRVIVGSIEPASPASNMSVRQFTRDGDLLNSIDPAPLVFTVAPDGTLAAGDSPGRLHNMRREDTSPARVRRLSGDAQLISDLELPEYTTPTLFNAPQSVALDAYGNVFVADTGNNRIVKLSPEGVLLTTWGERGTAAGQFDQPRWVTVDPRGNVYVADFGNNRIQQLPAEANRAV